MAAPASNIGLSRVPFPSPKINPPPSDEEARVASAVASVWSAKASGVPASQGVTPKSSESFFGEIERHLAATLEEAVQWCRDIRDWPGCSSLNTGTGWVGLAEQKPGKIVYHLKPVRRAFCCQKNLYSSLAHLSQLFSPLLAGENDVFLDLRRIGLTEAPSPACLAGWKRIQLLNLMGNPGLLNVPAYPGITAVFVNSKTNSDFYRRSIESTSPTPPIHMYMRIPEGKGQISFPVDRK